MKTLNSTSYSKNPLCPLHEARFPNISLVFLMSLGRKRESRFKSQSNWLLIGYCDGAFKI